MSNRKRDMFAAQYAPRDRQADEDAVAAFLKKGGKVTHLVSSEDANRILAGRRRKDRVIERRQDKENPTGVVVGIPLRSDLDAITVRDED
jgi:hypothetical protein